MIANLNQNSEESLYERIKRGENSAWQEVYDISTRFLMGKFSETLENAQDISQEVLVKLLSGALDKYNPQKKEFEKWILLITSRTAIDQLRRKKFRDSGLKGYAIYKKQLENEINKVEENETRQNLERLIEMAPLSEKQLEVIMAGYSKPKKRIIYYLAESLQIPIGTVKSRLSNALETLRETSKKLEYQI